MLQALAPASWGEICLREALMNAESLAYLSAQEQECTKPQQASLSLESPTLKLMQYCQTSQTHGCPKAICIPL